MKKIVLKKVLALGTMLFCVMAFAGPIYKVVINNQSSFPIPYDPNSVIMTNSFWCKGPDRQPDNIIKQIHPGTQTAFACAANQYLGLFHTTVNYVVYADSENPKIGCGFYAHCEDVNTVNGEQVCRSKLNGTIESQYSGPGYTVNCTTSTIDPSSANGYVGTVTFNIDINQTSKR